MGPSCPWIDSTWELSPCLEGHENTLDGLGVFWSHLGGRCSEGQGDCTWPPHTSQGQQMEWHFLVFWEAKLARGGGSMQQPLNSTFSLPKTKKCLSKAPGNRSPVDTEGLLYSYEILTKPLVRRYVLLRVTGPGGGHNFL